MEPERVAFVLHMVPQKNAATKGARMGSSRAAFLSCMALRSNVAATRAVPMESSRRAVLGGRHVNERKWNEVSN